MVVRESKIKMLRDHQHFSRIDILDMSLQIRKKLGNHKAEKYFALLGRFFSSKLGKPEFNKLCIATVGRENIGLHNCFIRSVLKNVCLAKTPPPKGSKFQRSVVIEKVANGCQKSLLQSLCKDALPKSPRRGRTPGFHAHRSSDRPSPLGPYGKPGVVSCKDSSQKALEQQSATELLSLGSPPVETISVEDGEEVDQGGASPGSHSRSSVTPPLGIPWNGKGNRKVLSVLSSSAVLVETCHANGELPDTSFLRKRLEQKLEAEGLGVSLDCVNLLNSGLDVFLKRLIKPSLELASSRIGNKQRNRMPVSASLLDFQTAVELNPQILGEDWPVQLEKLRLQRFQDLDES